jgi:hypothetical protein
MTLSLFILFLWPALASNELKKRKRFLTVVHRKSIIMPFLRPEVTDMYNNGMNNIDIADQLQGTYRLYCWMRKHK